MFKASKILEEVSSFLVKGAKLITKNNEALFEQSLFINQNLIPSSLGIAYYYLFGDNIIFSNWSKTYFCYDKKNHQTEKLFEGYKKKSRNFNDGSFFVSKKINSKEVFFLYNFKERNIKIKNNFWHLELGNQNLKIFEGKELISLISNRNDSILWTFDLKDLGKYDTDSTGNFEYHRIHKILGLYKEELLVSITNNKIITIDINTGMINRQWKEIYGHRNNLYNHNYINSSRSFYLEAEQKIVGCFQCLYWEIDLESGRISIKNFYEKFSPKRFTIRKLYEKAITDNHFIAIAEQVREDIEGSDYFLIALNRTTLEIDWQRKFPYEEGIRPDTNGPVYDAGKLYMLDWENRLHIFEKEEKT